MTRYTQRRNRSFNGYLWPTEFLLTRNRPSTIAVRHSSVPLDNECTCNLERVHRWNTGFSLHFINASRSLSSVMQFSIRRKESK